MRVLLITSTFPRFLGDNQVPWLAQLVLRLKERGMQIVVYVPGYKGLRDHIYDDVPVLRFRYAPKSAEILTHEEGAVSKLREKQWLYSVVLLYVFFGLYGLFRLRRRFRFDVIHVHWPFPNGLFGIAAKWLFGAKLILSFHAAEFTLLERIPFGAPLLKIILNYADAVVANSTFTKNMIEKIAPVHVQIIPFSSALSTNGAKTLIHSHKPMRVLFVGRLIERKGVSYLLEAISLLKKKGVPVRVDIAGDGPLFGKLVRQSQRLNISGQVHMHGEVSPKKLTTLYQQTEVFILPAIVDQWGDTEGFGVVLVEAMSFGKPIIASHVGGIPTVVKHEKNGLLVPEKDPVRLGEAIERLMEDPKLFKILSINGLALVKRNYNWESIVDKTLSLYATTTKS